MAGLLGDKAVIFRILVNTLILLHLAFVLYVVLGGLLAWRWPRMAWLHLPAAAWGALIEFTGCICPLTPLEKRLRAMGGLEGYDGGFIQHYILPILYPSGLTRGMQIALGSFVIVLNLMIYARLIQRRLQVSGRRESGRA